MIANNILSLKIGNISFLEHRIQVSDQVALACLPTTQRTNEVADQNTACARKQIHQSPRHLRQRSAVTLEVSR